MSILYFFLQMVLSDLFKMSLGKFPWKFIGLQIVTQVISVLFLILEDNLFIILEDNTKALFCHFLIAFLCFVLVCFVFCIHGLFMCVT